MQNVGAELQNATPRTTTAPGAAATWLKLPFSRNAIEWFVCVCSLRRHGTILVRGPTGRGAHGRLVACAVEIKEVLDRSPAVVPIRVRVPPLAIEFLKGGEMRLWPNRV